MKRDDGFTLLEVLLALMIFALMGAIVYGAFSLGHAAVERTQGRFENNQRMRSFGDLLGSYIRSSFPYRITPQDGRVFFIGEEERLTFVSSFSLALGGRGMGKVSIWVEADETGRGVLRLEEEIPVRLNAEMEQGGVRHGVALQEHVSEFRLAYLDPQTGAEEWHPNWDAQERKVLPRAVRLNYKNAEGKEVHLVFPVMVSVLAR